MVATSARIQQLTEGSNLLNILSEFLRNPKLIEELEAEEIRLNTLSVEEQKKLHDAQMLVQEYDKLVKDIADARKTQADEKTKHEAKLAKDLADFEAYVAKETVRIETLIKNNKAREEELADYSKRLDQRENLLKEKAATVNSLFGG